MSDRATWQTASRAGADMAANGPAPDAAAAFFDGSVMHQRMKPVGHRFTYDVFSLMVDLDRLAEADGLSRLFSVNRSTCSPSTRATMAAARRAACAAG